MSCVLGPDRKPLEEIDDEDVQFLREIDSRVCSFSRMEEPYRPGRMCWCPSHDYEVVLQPSELERIFEITERRGFVLTPTTGAFGFYPCFQVLKFDVAAPGAPPDSEIMLYFAEKQLPEGNDFSSMAEQFMKPRNLELAGIVGIEIENNRTHYDY